MSSGIVKNNGETDDYSLEPVPVEARRSWLSLFNAILGMATALFYMQVGSLMALNYGIGNAFLALIYATVLGGILGYVTSYIAAKTGMSSHLLGRAGFGFIGIACFSLIYGMNSLMYFAIEGSIMSTSVHSLFPAIPLWVIMVIVGLGMIPLSWYGIKLIEKFQKWTVGIYIIMLAIAVVISIAFSNNETNWSQYMTSNVPISFAGFLACLGIMNGVIAIMVLNIADFSRFIKPNEMKIGNLFIGVFTHVGWFLIAGSFGIWFGVSYVEANPGIYFVAMLGAWGTFFAVVTQLRINLGNLYLGSVSFSNFLSQVFRYTPGRNFSVVLFSVIATILMIFNVIHYMEFLISLSGVFLMALLSCILTDVFVVKKVLKIGPETLEYRSTHLRAFNPVGLLSFIISSIIGVIMLFGMMGPFWEPIAAIVAGVINTILYIILSIVTKGRYYYPKSSVSKELSRSI